MKIRKSGFVLAVLTLLLLSALAGAALAERVASTPVPAPGGMPAPARPTARPTAQATEQPELTPRALQTEEPAATATPRPTRSSAAAPGTTSRPLVTARPLARPASTPQASEAPAENSLQNLPRDTQSNQSFDFSNVPREQESFEQGPLPASDDETEWSWEGTAPDFTVLNDWGAVYRLASYRGRPVAIHFWTSWSEECQEELKFYDQLIDDYSDRVQFLMVDIVRERGDSVLGIQKFMKANGYRFQVRYDVDGTVAHLYDINYLPTTVFIDSEGNAVKKLNGPQGDEGMRAALDELIRSEQPEEEEEN